MLLVIVISLLSAAATAQVTPQPEPAKPHIQTGWNTTNLFWPGETDAISNVTYACTYTGYVVMAGSRLVAWGGCNPNPQSCNGYHALPPSSKNNHSAHYHNDNSTSSKALRTRTSLPASVCMKYSEDSGRSWSQIRMKWTEANEPMGLGMHVYDKVTKTIVHHFTSNGTVFQTTSVDQGDTWTKLVNVTAFLGQGFPVSTFDCVVGPGAGVQLSATNKFAPGRLLFAGHHGRYTYDSVWYSDDHAKTWKIATNKTTGQPLQLAGLDEPAIAETPSGGVTVRARNMNLFHGEGKCNCRGKADSDNGGTSFGGQVGYDAGLPSPVCQGTMINDGPSIIYR